MHQTATQSPTDDPRLLGLQQWLADLYPQTELQLTPIVGDASFRRYFRTKLGQDSFIAMDAPPELEASQPFVDIAERYHVHGLCVPQIIHQDLNQGYLLISDFGQALLLPALNKNTCDQHYRLAIRELIKLQTIPTSEQTYYPDFSDALFREELTNFSHWLLEAHLQLDLSTHEQQMLTAAYDFLIEQALSQPQVCVHRDYHSRNLMLLPDDKLGILDFQDAVWGPVTYDLISLIRDCYIAWPAEQVEQWCHYFYQLALEANIIQQADFHTFKQWCEIMALQRHLKAMFIFARKWHRDQCPNFLADIPRTLTYALAESQCHPALAELHHFLQQKVAPRILTEV